MRAERNINKFLSLLLSIFSFLNLAYGNEEIQWKKLNANVQNLTRKIQSKKGSQDPEIFQPELTNINESLNSLVELGHLKLSVVNFKFNGSLEKLLDEITEEPELNTLISEYGIYTASEMLDLAKFFRGEVFKKDGVVRLRTRLPKEKSKVFMRVISRYK